jgi:negative regulator of flagellin synthesis FlgM
MEVHGPGGVGGIGPIYNQPTSRAPKESQPTSASSEDQVQISSEAKLLSDVNLMLTKIPDIREDKVAEVRQLIDQGQYETPDKLDVAVDRLLGEMLGE